MRVTIRVKSKGNKIGAAALSRLNKMGNPTQILKKINDLVAKEPTKKCLVVVDGLGADQRFQVAYPGDAQMIVHLRSKGEISQDILNEHRSKYNMAPITTREYEGILQSINA